MMFKMGTIIGVNETDNTILVKDNYDATVVTVPLDNILQLQIMPVVGNSVLYYNIDDKIFKAIKIWEIQNNPLIRQNEYPLRSGEVQLMGLFGQYIHLDRNGKIVFVDSTLLNHFELTLNGFIAQLKEFEVNTYDGVYLKLDKDITIGRKVVNEEDTEDGETEPEYEFLMTINDEGMTIARKDVEITIDNNNQVQIKGDKINLGAELLGKVVTGGVPSPDNVPTHPFCFVTGAPILGSENVKAKK